MIEPELKKSLDQINASLMELQKANRTRNAFFRGVLSGIGSILGIAIALGLFGWILNAMGVIPAFQQQANEWKQTLDRIERIR